MKNMRRQGRIAIAGGAIAALAVLAGCSPGGGGEESEVSWTLATMAPAGSDHQAAESALLDLIEEKSDGRISINRTEPLSMCAAAEIVECVIDGRAEIGSGVPDYTPHYFPAAGLAGIPFLEGDWQAITKSQEQLHQQNESVAQAMDDLGLYHASTYPVGRVLFGTKEPLDGPEDIDNLSLRGSGPSTIRMLEMSGGNIVSLPADEAYEAIDRGVVDALAGTFTFADSYALDEILPHWTDPGVGEYSNYGLWINQSAYGSLSEDLQAIVDEASAEFNDGLAAEATAEAVAEMCEELKGRGNVETVTTWDEDTVEDWSSDLLDPLLEGWIGDAQNFGITDAEDVLNEYRQLLDEHKNEEFQDPVVECVESF